MTPFTRGLSAFLLLIASNVFMTYAWYNHLRKPSWSIVKAIVCSWLIAGVEYCLMVPANRIGHVEFGGPLGAPQLKIMQEFISLTVFSIFSSTVLKERLSVRDAVAFAFILVGVVIGMSGKMHVTPATSSSGGEMGLVPSPPPLLSSSLLAGTWMHGKLATLLHPPPPPPSHHVELAQLAMPTELTQDSKTSDDYKMPS